MEYLVLILIASIILTCLSYISIYYQFGRTTSCLCTVDLRGKTVLVTGGSSGIGKETAKALACMGARVIIASSNTFKCIAAVQEIQVCSGNKNVDFYQVDLSDMTSVRKLALDINNHETHLHILINNAGIGYHKKAKTKDGYDRIFATNYLGHFLLTYLLVGKLKNSAPSRVVNVASVCQRLTTQGLNLSKHIKNGGSDLYPKLRGYESSKIALILFTKELSRRLAECSITVNAVHPGINVNSDIWNKAEYILPKPMAMFLRLFVRGLSQDATSSAQNVIHTAISPSVEGISGKYFEKCQTEKENEQASDVVATSQLWNISMILTGCTHGGKVVQQLSYENEVGHDKIKAYDYLLLKTQKVITSPEMDDIDRRCYVPNKGIFSYSS